MVDGLQVQLLDGAGHAIKDEEAVPGEWPFVRPAPGHWDLNRWMRERITTPLRGCLAVVNPDTFGGLLPLSASMTRARRQATVFPLAAMSDEVLLRTGPQWVVLHDRRRSVSPPRRDGAFGEILVRDGGLAMWSGFDDDQGAYVSLDGED